MRTRRSAAPSKRSSTRQEVRASRPRGRADGHPLPVHGVAADRGVDLAGGAGGRPEDEGEVLLLDRAPGELPDEGAVGLVVLGDDEQAGGAPVEPVDDAGAEDAAHAGEVAHVARGARSRACRRAVPAPGCTTRPAGLFTTTRWASSWTTASGMSSGCGSAGTGAGTWTCDALPGAEPGRGAGAAAVEQHVAVVDQRLEPGPGEGRQAPSEPHVESPALGLLAGDELVPLHYAAARIADSSSPDTTGAPRNDRRPGRPFVGGRDRAIADAGQEDRDPQQQDDGDELGGGDRRPPNQAPRSGSPRRNSRPKRTAE